jgi:hypothetical protein
MRDEVNVVAVRCLLAGAGKLELPAGLFSGYYLAAFYNSIKGGHSGQLARFFGVASYGNDVILPCAPLDQAPAIIRIIVNQQDSSLWYCGTPVSSSLICTSTLSDSGMIFIVPSLAQRRLVLALIFSIYNDGR